MPSDIQPLLHAGLLIVWGGHILHAFITLYFFYIHVFVWQVTLECRVYNCFHFNTIKKLCHGNQFSSVGYVYGRCVTNGLPIVFYLSRWPPLFVNLVINQVKSNVSNTSVERGKECDQGRLGLVRDRTRLCCWGHKARCNTDSTILVELKQSSLKPKYYFMCKICIVPFAQLWGMS